MAAVANRTPATAGVLALQSTLQEGRRRVLRSARIDGLDLQLVQGHDALWLMIRRANRGGLAYRVGHFPAGIDSARMVRRKRVEVMRAAVMTPLGDHSISIEVRTKPVPMIHARTVIRARCPLLPTFVPRDLYPIGWDDDPFSANGQVEAAQRGLNTGAIYFRVTDPDFGSVLYLQDLTYLNPYFNATKTKPDGAMGGVWPEVGFLVPTPAQQGTPPVNPLPAGQEIVLSDGWIAIHQESGGDERDMAKRYLSMLGQALTVVARPTTEFHDWIDRAERTLADLAASPKATIRHYGHLYVHPYTSAEYPDSMVQLSVLSSIRDYENWSGQKVPLGRKLAEGLSKFYDTRLGTLRRYLPNVGKDKDRNAVDSWYLYHPLSKLGRLAANGDKKALRLFKKSIGYGIKAARHFHYKWPIQYDLRDFRVITEARDDLGLGQTDVGGLYAYVMLQAFELTDDKMYLDEARAAIDATRGMRFELNYQANLTAWGAAACMRLWRITGQDEYRRQTYVFLASFFHNTAMWESEIEHARHYRNFLGVTALHDAPYMALYECFDSFDAFEQLLRDSGPDFDDGARLLITEYCRHALDRAWFYYPDALPPEVISPEQRENNGHIDRSLSFPVEDLYVDGQPAGQVGQEIYGSGAALVFASRAFHRVQGGSFVLFCDHFIVIEEQPIAKALTFRILGSAGNHARVVLARSKSTKLPSFKVVDDAGRAIRPDRRGPDRAEYLVPACATVTVAWR